jgi:antitoxin component YwqK of YwqJK toxin-antitoxin module
MPHAFPIRLICVCTLFPLLVLSGCSDTKTPTAQRNKQTYHSLKGPLKLPANQLPKGNQPSLLSFLRSGNNQGTELLKAVSQPSGILNEQDLKAIEALFVKYAIEREHTHILVDLRTAKRLTFESKQDVGLGINRMIAAWERIKLLHHKSKGSKRYFWDHMLIQVGNTLRLAIQTKRPGQYRKTITEIENAFLQLAFWWGQKEIVYRVDKAHLKRSIIKIKALFTELIIDIVPEKLRQGMFRNRIFRKKKRFKYIIKRTFKRLVKRGTKRIPYVGRVIEAADITYKLARVGYLTYLELKMLRAYSLRQYQTAKKLRRAILRHLQSHLKQRYAFRYWKSGCIQSISQKNKNKKHGWHARFSPLGEVRERGQYTAGHQDGTWKIYHPNGKMREMGDYAKGKKIGIWKAWSFKGELLSRLQYVAGRLHGPQETWYPNGKKRTHQSYEHGVRNGDFVKYLPNGKVTNKQTFESGKRTLHQTYPTTMSWLHSQQIWYPNGKPKSIRRYKSKTWGTQQHGVSTGWYPDGKLAWKESYHEGKQHGEFRTYDKRGNLRTWRWYHNGRPNKTWVQYGPDGSIFSQKQFRKGSKQGKWTFYNPNDFSYRIEHYANGKKHGLFQWGTRIQGFSLHQPQVRIAREEIYSHDKRVTQTTYKRVKGTIHVTQTTWLNTQKPIVRRWTTQGK